MARKKQAEPLHICSFCTKSQDEVRRMVAAPENAAICDECVYICLEILILNDGDPMGEEELARKRFVKQFWDYFSRSWPAPASSEKKPVDRKM